MRFWAMAFSSVVLTCSWLTTSWNVCGRYFRAITWYMGRADARPRVIRGTRTALLPLLPSGPGGVCSRPLHGARDLTSIHRNMGLPGHTLHVAASPAGRLARLPQVAVVTAVQEVDCLADDQPDHQPQPVRPAQRIHHREV